MGVAQTAFSSDGRGQPWTLRSKFKARSCSAAAVRQEEGISGQRLEVNPTIEAEGCRLQAEMLISQSFCQRPALNP